MPRDTGHDEVGDLARALARMQEELRRQEAARRAFVATASHELRTPLTMLQGTMELLAEDLEEIDADVPDAQRQVATARRELLRLSTLAEELLDLSRLDAAVALRSEAVELGELARAVAAEFGLRAGERDTAIKVVPPGAVLGPRRPRRGRARRADPDRQRAALRRRRRHPRDRGRGRHRRGRRPRPRRPVEERERIFERFYRGRVRGSEGGFGLGLAIGRELAERMGGRSRSPTAPAAARASRSRCRAPTAAVCPPEAPAPEAVTQPS